MSLSELKQKIKSESNKSYAKTAQWFFKTGKGEYGEDDVFVGIKVPRQRKIANEFKSLHFGDIKKLLGSKIHEERLIALLILVLQFEKGEELTREKIYKFYITSIAGVNNWDLVDLSAPKIVGAYLLNKDKKILYKFARSKILWERRISIVSTYTFIKNKSYTDALKISELLLSDEEDLIHKAVGWMLREVGKGDLKTEEKFLKKHYKIMPRTMLRYAIEKFPEAKRIKYLKGEI